MLSKIVDAEMFRLRTVVVDDGCDYRFRENINKRSPNKR